MASISRDPGGRRRILFVGADGQRRPIRLGKCSQRDAASIKLRVEALLSATLRNLSPDQDTSAWLGGLDNKLYGKLAHVGLVPPREPKSQAQGEALGDFLQQYISGRTDVKEGTRFNLGHAGRFLLDFFGPQKPLASITAGDADEFRRYLLTRVGENTGRRLCGRAKQFFRAALRKKLIQEDPFADMKGVGVKGNPSRFYFVNREEAQKVLDACPDAEWRLLFALSRYGGLRCPSEHLLLRWGDVDWERGRITVHSPKTEHCEGHESRQIPLFPELRPYLEAVWEQAEPGTEYIITRHRGSNANRRTQLERIIRRAGLEPWPKPFQNLRSTRETELAETYPLHVVCAWIGNSEPVATKHYLQVTDEHFQQALTGGANSGALAAQNAAQPVSAALRHVPQETPEALENQGVWGEAASCGATWPTVQATLPG